MTQWGQPFLPVLYIQLDNATRENKNSTMFGYLSMLVDQGLFSKVKVNFLLVTHTHDHIDKMFSTFSRQLSRHDAFTLPKLFHFMSFVLHTHHAQKCYTWRRYMTSRDIYQMGVLGMSLRNMPHNKTCHGGMNVLVIKKELSTIVYLLIIGVYKRDSRCRAFRLRIVARVGWKSPRLWTRRKKNTI